MFGKIPAGEQLRQCENESLGAAGRSGMLGVVPHKIGVQQKGLKLDSRNSHKQCTSGEIVW